MERIGLWRLSRNAWRDGTETMRRNTSLFTVAFLCLLVLDAAILSVTPATPTRLAIQADPGILRHYGLTSIGAGLLGGLVRLAIVTPCALLAHRYVLLGETDRPHALNQRRVVRFALCLLSIDLLVGIPSGLVGLVGLSVTSIGAGAGGALSVIFGVALIAACIISVRFTLVFPAVAVDHATPWGESWRLSRRHWWRIVGASFVCIGLFAIGVGLLALIGRVLPPAGTILVTALVEAASGIVLVAVGAALASWLFRDFGGAADAAGSIWTGDPVSAAPPA